MKRNAAGESWRTPSKALRVSGRDLSCRPARAKSIFRSRLVSAPARTPRRFASAVRACALATPSASCAWLRWTSAMALPRTARASRTTAPTRSARRRRFVRRCRTASRWLPCRLAARNSRSSSFSSGSWAVAQSPVTARRAPERARPGSRAERLPLLRSFGQPAVEEPALPVLVEPGAERRPRANERLVRKFNRVPHRRSRGGHRRA